MLLLLYVCTRSKNIGYPYLWGICYPYLWGIWTALHWSSYPYLWGISTIHDIRGTSRYP